MRYIGDGTRTYKGRGRYKDNTKTSMSRGQFQGEDKTEKGWETRTVMVGHKKRARQVRI